MQWVSVTLASGKSSVVDFSKVMNITVSGDGSRLHFNQGSADANGKTAPLGLNIKEPMQIVAKSLKAKRFY